MTSELGRRDPVNLYSPPKNLAEGDQIYVNGAKVRQTQTRKVRVYVRERLRGHRG